MPVTFTQRWLQSQQQICSLFPFLKFLQIVSAQKENGPIHLSQDANIFVSELDSGKKLEYGNASDRQSAWSALKGIWILMDQIWKNMMPWKLPEKNI